MASSRPVDETTRVLVQQNETLKWKNEALKRENELLKLVVENVCSLAESAEQEQALWSLNRKNLKLLTAAAEQELRSKRLQDLLLKKIKRFLDKIDYLETTNEHLEDAMSELGFENDQLDARNSHLQHDVTLLDDQNTWLEREMQSLESNQVDGEITIRRAPRRRFHVCVNGRVNPQGRSGKNTTDTRALARRVREDEKKMHEMQQSDCVEVA